jgi:hypothetical protein
MLSVYPLINFSMPHQIFMNLGMYIMASGLNWTTYFINPSHSPCIYMCIPLMIARQWLGKHVSAATNTRKME